VITIREVLYKAKRIDNGEWVIGNLFIEGNRAEIVRGTCNGAGIEGIDVNSETICQYTGLKDKNRNKIFENDICLINDGILDYKDGYFLIEWHDNDAQFTLLGNRFLVNFGNVHGFDCEVVGNKFDNPELHKHGN
jgi:uncharacterized phage protein (TIGR01671 family)